MGWEYRQGKVHMNDSDVAYCLWTKYGEATAGDEELTTDWKRVTCKRCLKKKEHSLNQDKKVKQ